MRQKADVPRVVRVVETKAGVTAGEIPIEVGMTTTTIPAGETAVEVAMVAQEAAAVAMMVMVIASEEPKTVVKVMQSTRRSRRRPSTVTEMRARNPTQTKKATLSCACPTCSFARALVLRGTRGRVRTRHGRVARRLTHWLRVEEAAVGLRPAVYFRDISATSFGRPFPWIRRQTSNSRRYGRAPTCRRELGWCGPDDSGSSRTGGSGSLSGFNEASVDASSGAISDADDVPCRGMINYAASPRYSAPSPADVANSLSDLVGPLPLLGTVENDDELVAKSSDCSAPAAGPADLGPAVSQESRTSTAPADYDPGTIEDAKGGRQAADLEDGGDGSESIEGDGGGAESEEEWLSHSLGDAASVPGSAQRSEGSEGASMFQEENPLNPNHDCCASHSGNSEPFSSTPVSTKEQGEKQTEEDPAAEVESSWAGLNEDGSWKTEYARRAAGDAGAAEAERRRLAKVKADESWRSDGRKCGGTGCHGAQGVRRESRSFTRLTGNVRDKLSVFEGAPSAKAAKETTGNRSSLGALHGRGLVSAWAKKSANYASPPVATRKDCGSPSHIWSDGARRASRLTDSRSRGRSDQAEMDDVDEQDGEFLWKAGPAPCRLKGRPSLNLIRNGQVRIMSKALLMSCPESGDDHVFGRIDEKIGATPKATHAGGSSGASSSEPPAPSRSPSQQPLPPPPRVPISPPLTQTSPVDAGANRCPHPEHGSPDGSGFEQRPAVPRGNFWLAKAGLTRKGAGGGCATPAPATTSRSGDAWRKAGDTFTSPVTCAMGRVAAGVATAARVNDATHGSREEGHGRPLASVRSWANLRRRLGEERKSMGGEETASPGVSSG
ncbi:unnamed protein product [Scytosiphon promiscuus]